MACAAWPASRSTLARPTAASADRARARALAVAGDGGGVLAAPMAELGERQARLGVLRPYGHDVFNKLSRFVGPSGLEGERPEQIERRRIVGVGGEHLTVEMFGLGGETGAMAVERRGERRRRVWQGIGAGHAASAGIFCPVARVATPNHIGRKRTPKAIEKTLFRTRAALQPGARRRRDDPARPRRRPSSPEPLQASHRRGRPPARAPLRRGRGRCGVAAR